MVLEWLRDLFLRGSSARGVSVSAREQWLDVIERHGYSAHFYMPGIEHRDDRELWEALESLKNAGFIITAPNGSLVGKVAKARLSPDEQVRQRRAQFKIVE